MGILSASDINRMGADVRDAITDWDAPVTIKVPKPIVSQTNYNDLMREFTGEILYDEYSVGGEWRSKAENKQLNIDVSGDSMINKSILVLPDTLYADPPDNTESINTISICSKDTIILDDTGRKYRVSSIRTNIGQVSLELLQLVGGE